MAETLDPTGEFDDAPRAYPWDEWLDGRPHRLDPASDFSRDPWSFRFYIYKVASKRGLSVAIAVEPTDHIVIQSYVKGERRPKLPSPYRRLANGKMDRTAPAEHEKATEGRSCQSCGRRLTPAGITAGVCMKLDRGTGTLVRSCPEQRSNDL